jgi:hypothetical protein
MLPAAEQSSADSGNAVDLCPTYDVTDATDEAMKA